MIKSNNAIGYSYWLNTTIKVKVTQYVAIMNLYFGLKLCTCGTEKNIYETSFLMKSCSKFVWHYEVFFVVLAGHK